jgi:hypothetical protein
VPTGGAALGAVTARVRHDRRVQHRDRGSNAGMGAREAGDPTSARCAREDGRRVASPAHVPVEALDLGAGYEVAAAAKSEG